MEGAWSHIIPDSGVLPCSLEGLAWFYSKVKLGARLRVWTTSLSEMGIVVGNGSALLNHLGIGDDRKWGPVFPAINYASDRLAWPGWDEHGERRARVPFPGPGATAAWFCGFLVSVYSSLNGGCWWTRGELGKE